MLLEIIIALLGCNFTICFVRSDFSKNSSIIIGFVSGIIGTVFYKIFFGEIYIPSFQEGIVQFCSVMTSGFVIYNLAKYWVNRIK